MGMIMSYPGSGSGALGAILPVLLPTETDTMVWGTNAKGAQ